MESRKKHTRREFVEGAVTLTAAAALGTSWVKSDVLASASSGIAQRDLGHTGVRVSMVGLGGFHLGSVGKEHGEAYAFRLCHKAIAEGMTFMDNAWDYHDGYAEELMGKALRGKRNEVFLMSKMCHQDYKGAKKDLEDSLRRLKTDHLDLWQVHEVNYDSDPDFFFEKGGVRAAIDATRAGKVRFVGFTGHKSPSIHLKMLGKDYPWATVQCPINIADYYYDSFQRKLIPECRRRGIGVIGMKSLAGRRGMLVGKQGLTMEQCRRYSLSLPISTLVCGILSMDELDGVLRLAQNFQPVTGSERKSLLAQAKPIAEDGGVELFKTSKQFDGHVGHHLNSHA